MERRERKERKELVLDPLPEERDRLKLRGCLKRTALYEHTLPGETLEILSVAFFYQTLFL